MNAIGLTSNTKRPQPIKRKRKMKELTFFCLSKSKCDVTVADELRCLFFFGYFFFFFFFFFGGVIFYYLLFFFWNDSKTTKEPAKEIIHKMTIITVAVPEIDYFVIVVGWVFKRFHQLPTTSAYRFMNNSPPMIFFNYCFNWNMSGWSSNELKTVDPIISRCPSRRVELLRFG